MVGKFGDLGLFGKIRLVEGGFDMEQGKEDGSSSWVSNWILGSIEGMEVYNQELGICARFRVDGFLGFHN